MPTQAHLLDDIDALKAIIRKRDEVVASPRDEFSNRTSEIEHLKLLIAKLKRLQFGRKSEKLNRQIEQLELKLEDLQAAQEESATQPKQGNQAIRAHTRQPLPAHLPRQENVLLLQASACPDCGGNLRTLGEDDQK